MPVLRDFVYRPSNLLTLPGVALRIPLRDTELTKPTFLGLNRAFSEKLAWVQILKPRSYVNWCGDWIFQSLVSCSVIFFFLSSVRYLRIKLFRCSVIAARNYRLLSFGCVKAVHVLRISLNYFLFLILKPFHGSTLVRAYVRKAVTIVIPLSFFVPHKLS